MTWFFVYTDRRKMVYTGNSGWYSRSFLLSKGGYSVFYDNENIVRQVCTGICAAPAFRRGATKAEARRTEPCGIRRTPAIFRLSEWKAYNVLNIHSENDRDVVRFEKVRSEPLDFPINCPPPSNGIEWTCCEKIRKDNFGGLVSEPILNHKMNQYWYYVKF